MLHEISSRLFFSQLSTTLGGGVQKKQIQQMFESVVRISNIEYAQKITPSASSACSFQPSAFQPVDVSLPDVGSAGSAGTPRCAASVTLRGDVAALAPNTPPRRAFEKKFVADIADALSVEAACVAVLGLRSGSIIVDFLVEKEGADHGGFVRELRRQVLDPSSPLLNGKVTHSCVTVAGEVEL